MADVNGAAPAPVIPGAVVPDHPAPKPVPPPPAPVVTPTAWLQWPPPRKAIMGGIGGIVAWFLLSLAQHFLGFDPQTIMVQILGPQAPDLDALITGAVTLAIVHWTTPSTKDIVDHTTNATVEIATATQTNPTTAVVTDEKTADAQVKQNIMAGKLPPTVMAMAISQGALAP